MDYKLQGGNFSKLPFKLSANRLGLLLILLGLLWGLYLLRVVIVVEENQKIDSQVLKNQIIELSKQYVNTLAKERARASLKHKRPAGSADEMKRTTAVLLQNMLERIATVEEELHLVIINSTLEFAKMHQKIEHLNTSIFGQNNGSNINPRVIIICEVPDDPKFPECLSRVQWLQSNWKSEGKYEKLGVNGSLCSILIYLSHVEHLCPINFPMTRKIITQAPSSMYRDCDVPSDVAYPHCQQKIEWMRRFWKSDAKYASHGVDGSICSFIKYLSEVESWCGLLPGRRKEDVNDCEIPKDATFAECGGKVAWMRKFWTTDTCYAKHGVNGSVCSFLIYLSEVEHWCPLLPHRTMPAPVTVPSALKQPPQLNQFSLHDLLLLMDDPDRNKYKWIKTRISRLWSKWVVAQEDLKKRKSLTDYGRKRILIYIGLLSDEQIYHFGAQATMGGPLGELVQWSDLISSSYLLGHDLTVCVNKERLRTLLNTGIRSSCPSTNGFEYDLIYTDYIGALHIDRMLRNINTLKCHLRLVDSFGTEAEFNNPTDPQLRTFYGAYRLNLKQFNTMFPHSPDNSFLGFVVENSLKPHEKVVKKPIALVYGKHSSMWEDHKKLQFLDIVQKYFEVHATVATSGKDEVKFTLPRYVINHGILSGSKIQALLKEAKVFVGMGFPFEGPAPLEAIANGCFFINIKYDPPIGRRNAKFFKNKPTFRTLSSQHPYAERFIGKPYVHTVRLDDMSGLENALKQMVNTTLIPYLPYEFTFEGMLDRLSVFYKHQDFCNKKQWPPLTARKVMLGDLNKSCQDVCNAQGLICEPAYFESINKVDIFKSRKVDCKLMEKVPSLIAPSLKTTTNSCLIQTSELMFSCTAKSPSVRRLCPCRDFLRGNTALCKGCQ